MPKLIVECDSCDGTGVYCGFAEPEGVAVVCLYCAGSGKQEIRYKKFTGRKRKRWVRTVSRSRGSFVGTGVGPTGGCVTYADFCKGKMPK